MLGFESQLTAHSRMTETYRTSRPCKYGHRSRRYAGNGTCVTCARGQIAARRAADPEATREYNRVSKWKQRGISTPTRPRPKLCECCGDPPPKSRPILFLDHDHKTGRFRGWLCNNCNVGLGKLRDSLRGVLRAASYLRRAKNS